MIKPELKLYQKRDIFFSLLCFNALSLKALIAVFHPVRLGINVLVGYEQFGK